MSVAIVGGGLGALRTAESLVAAGYAGEVNVISDENHLPYNRPPLSKEALKEGISAEKLEFRRRASTDGVAWILGDGARSASFVDRIITLDSGREFGFDG